MTWQLLPLLDPRSWPERSSLATYAHLETLSILSCVFCGMDLNLSFLPTIYSSNFYMKKKNHIQLLVKVVVARCGIFHLPNTWFMGDASVYCLIDTLTEETAQIMPCQITTWDNSSHMWTNIKLLTLFRVTSKLTLHFLLSFQYNRTRQKYWFSWTHNRKNRSAYVLACLSHQNNTTYFLCLKNIDTISLLVFSKKITIL